MPNAYYKVLITLNYGFGETIYESENIYDDGSQEFYSHTVEDLISFMPLNQQVAVGVQAFNSTTYNNVNVYSNHNSQSLPPSDGFS